MESHYNCIVMCIMYIIDDCILCIIDDIIIFFNTLH